MSTGSKQGSEGVPPSIGRYRVIAPLAKGGMAEVYVVIRDGRDTPSVLKRLLQELEAHPTAALRFQRETELSTRLQHPRIVRTLRTASEEGRPCIEMELVPGQTVEDMMLALSRHQRLPPLDCAVRIALDALEGLAYAHDLRGDDGRPLGLVHRDISPRNIVLGFDGAARLIDFGIARAEWKSYLTAPGAVLGTFSHASPEQAVGSAVDRRSDLYSLGVVLYEMLTGQNLVPPGETMEMLKRVTTESPPPVRELNPNLPPALEAVLAQALQKRPEDRFPDADSFIAALERAAPTQESESRRRLGALLSQLFPESPETFRHYEREAARLAREGVVVPTQLGEGVELTQAHTGFTELVGQKTTVDQTMVVRTRSRAGTPAPVQRRRAPPWLAIGLGVPALVIVTALALLRADPDAGRTEESRSAPPAPPLSGSRGPKAVAAAEAPAPEPLEVEAPAEPEPEAEAAPDAVEPTHEEPRPSGPVERARKRPTSTAEPKASPPAPPPAPVGNKPRARLETLAKRLRSDPGDAALFEATAQALQKALAELPEEKRRPLRARIQRAEVMNDAQILLGALDSFLAQTP